MISTIQVSSDLKDSLQRMKEVGQSYEEVILGMIVLMEKQRRSNNALLIRGYKEMAEESLKINDEWSSTDLDWNEN